MAVGTVLFYMFIGDMDRCPVARLRTEVRAAKKHGSLGEEPVSEAIKPSSTIESNRPERSANRDVQWLGIVPSLLILSSLIAYSILRTAYGRFYSTFGLTPEDVGLDYAQTLARSTGLVLTWLLIPGFVLALSVTLIALLIVSRSEVLARSRVGARLLVWTPLHRVSAKEVLRFVAGATAITVFLSTLLTAFTMPLQAASYADYVHDGKATSLQSIGPFIQFDVRADQATYRVPVGDVVLITGNCPDAAVIGVGTVCRDW